MIKCFNRRRVRGAEKKRAKYFAWLLSLSLVISMLSVTPVMASDAGSASSESTESTETPATEDARTGNYG